MLNPIHLIFRFIADEDIYHFSLSFYLLWITINEKWEWKQKTAVECNKVFLQFIWSIETRNYIILLTMIVIKFFYCCFGRVNIQEKWIESEKVSAVDGFWWFSILWEWTEEKTTFFASVINNSFELSINPTQKFIGFSIYQK